MLKVLVVVSLLSVALGLPKELFIYDPEDSPITRHYHDTVGIAEAARIKAAEEAITFDGSRIAGGSNANLGQYPHLEGLIIPLTNGDTSVCGSSLISNSRLVTAAHCWWDGMRQALQFTVVLGSLTLFSGGTRIITNQVVMHGSWDPRTITNDVAIISIPWVNYNNNIRNIGLAFGNNLYVGQWALAAGFGAQGDGLGIPPTQQLHHVQLQVLSNNACSEWYGNSIVPSNLCIDGSARRSTCAGDSGGPLTIGNSLIGIASFGFMGGCEQGWPAGFSRVTSFESWIRGRL